MARRQPCTDTVSTSADEPPNAEAADLSALGFIREPQLLQLLPVCRSTLWEGVRTGRYPAPVKISSRAVAWRVTDVRRMLKELRNV
jgi:prophage regulatory protein